MGPPGQALVLVVVGDHLVNHPQGRHQRHALDQGDDGRGPLHAHQGLVGGHPHHQVVAVPGGGGQDIGVAHVEHVEAAGDVAYLHQ